MNNEDFVYIAGVDDVPEDVVLDEPTPEPKTYTTDELIGIYSLLKAGFTAEDFS